MDMPGHRPEGTPAAPCFACQARAVLDRGGGWEDGGDRHVVAGGWLEANNDNLIALSQFPEGMCHSRRPIPVHVDYVHENAE